LESSFGVEAALHKKDVDSKTVGGRNGNLQGSLPEELGKGEITAMRGKDEKPGAKKL